MNKYIVSNTLPNCPKFSDRKIGSNWCTESCPHCFNIERDFDSHGRTDSLTVFCDPLEINFDKVIKQGNL